jgi:hypothetical protein
MRYTKQRTCLENTCSGNWIHQFTTCITESDIFRFRCYFEKGLPSQSEKLEMNIPLSDWKSSTIYSFQHCVCKVGRARLTSRMVITRCDSITDCDGITVCDGITGCYSIADCDSIAGCESRPNRDSIPGSSSP